MIRQYFTVLDQNAVRITALSVIVACCIVTVVALAGVGVTATEMSDSQQYSAVPATDNVSEAAYEEPVPEPGDQYFEAEDPDGDWISYINPRDKYRSPYLGDGSGKICVTLVNEEGEFVEGQSIPDTTVEVPTGESLEWHTHADPFTVEYPLTENYEQPFDADQFGTTSDLPQGDGYMDSHCMEIHGMPEDGTIEYGEASIDGEHADDVEVVGYIQQEHEAWDTDVDPIEDAESYEETGGGWTYHPDGSHGQAVIVLQLDGADGGANENVSSDSNGSSENDTDDSNGGNGDDDDAAAETIPGLGILTAIAALMAVSLLRLRR